MKQLRRPDATIHYIREGTGTPLVLVQGAGVIGEGWRPQIDALRASHAIVALDNRGIGGSTYRASALTIEDMAADVLAIADAEAFDRFHLAGHSIGGLIAQEIALRARLPRAGAGAVVHVRTRRPGVAAHARHHLERTAHPDRHAGDAPAGLHGARHAGRVSRRGRPRGARVAARDAVRSRSRRSAGDRHEAAGRGLTLRRQRPPAGSGWCADTGAVGAARCDRAAGVRPRARRAHSRRALRRDRGRGACRDDSVRA